MILEPEAMSQEAEMVSGPPKHDESGNDGSEKMTNGRPALR